MESRKFHKRNVYKITSARKAMTLLDQVQSLICSWAGSKSVAEIISDPRVAKRLEIVERGIRMIRAGFCDENLP